MLICRGVRRLLKHVSHAALAIDVPRAGALPIAPLAVALRTGGKALRSNGPATRTRPESKPRNLGRVYRTPRAN